MIRWLATSHDYVTSIRFQRKWNGRNSEIYNELSMFLFVKLLRELEMARILGLGILEEARNDFLYVSNRYLYFLFSILFSFIKNFFKAWAHIANLTFLVSNTNEWSLSHFEFVNVCDEENFLTHGADGSLELKQDWHDVSILFFPEQKSLVRVNFFILIFLKFCEVMIMMLSVYFRHDWVEIDSINLKLRIVKNVRCLIIGNDNFAQILICQWNPN